MRTREWLVGRAVKGGVPPRARPSPQIRPTPKQAGPQAPEHHANDRSREHNESPGALYGPAPRRYHPQIKAQSRRPSECAALAKPRFGSVRGVGDLTEPVGQRVACAGRLLCTPGGAAVNAQPSGAEERRWRDLAVSEPHRGRLRRRSGRVGPETPEPRSVAASVAAQRARASSQRRSTRPKPVSWPPREETSSSWRRSGREKAAPCGSNRATKTRGAEHLVSAKEHVPRSRAFRGNRRRQRRAARQGESGLRDRSRGSKSA